MDIRELNEPYTNEEYIYVKPIITETEKRIFKVINELDISDPHNFKQFSNIFFSLQGRIGRRQQNEITKLREEKRNENEGYDEIVFLDVIDKLTQNIIKN